MSSGARLALAYTLLFGWVGVYLPYFPGWLGARGLTGTQIGVLLGVVPWFRVALNPALGQVADRHGRAWRMVLGLALTCALGLVLYARADAFPAYLLASSLVAAGFAPLASLTDGIAVREAREGRMDYARVRAAGSMAFIVAVALVGAGVKRDGYEFVPALTVWMMLGIALTATVLPKPAPRRADGGPPPADARALLARPLVRRFLVGSALVQASHAVVYGFGTLHWERAGLGQDVIGQLWAVGVVVEVVVFLLGGPLADRVGPARLMMIAGIGGVLRWSVLACTTDLTLLFAAQSLHALSFACLHLGALELIRRRIPEQHTATGLYTAAGPGVGMGLATPLAGLLFDAFRGGAFWGAAVLSGMGALVLATIVPSRARDAATAE
ncbi:MAG: MFS transporter [Polyangiales bacterium]|nr:MFS transporter [Myxococcales bacterium]MCB9657161.1 MFS transporter [Sandaracinaceae bacterium]